MTTKLLRIIINGLRLLVARPYRLFFRRKGVCPSEINVRKWPYWADNTGFFEIEDAVEDGCSLYLPSGTYKISGVFRRSTRGDGPGKTFLEYK
jgi:hypothetical protein